MNLPRLRDYLGHMLTAAREALGFVEGMSRETFLDERRTQQAVVMSLLILAKPLRRSWTRIMPSWKRTPNFPGGTCEECGIGWLTVTSRRIMGSSGRPSAPRFHH
jgi:hypothetical protein